MASGFLSTVGRLFHGKRRDGQSHQARPQEEKFAGSPQVAAVRSEPSPSLYGPVQGMKKWEHSKKKAADQGTSSTSGLTEGDSSSAITSSAWTSTRRSPKSAQSGSARGDDSPKRSVEGSLAGPEGSGHRSGQSVLTSSQRKKYRPLSCFVAMPESPTEVRKVLLPKESSDVSPPIKDKAISAEGKQTVEGRKDHKRKLTLEKIDKKNERKQKDDNKKKNSRRPLSCIVQPPSPRPGLDENMVVSHWPQDPAPEPPLKSKEQDQAAAAGHRARPQAERHRPRPASCFVLPPPPNYPPPPGHPQPPPSPLKATPPHPGRPMSRAASPREGSPQPFYSGGSRLVRQVLSKSLEALDQISSLPKRQASYLPSSEEERDRRLSLTIAEPSPSHYEHIHGRSLRSCDPPVQTPTAAVAAAETSCQPRALYSKVTSRSNEILNLSYPEPCRFLPSEQQTDYSARHRRSSSAAYYTDTLLALSEPMKGRKRSAIHGNAMANFIHYWTDEHSNNGPETPKTIAPTKISEPGEQHNNHFERNSFRNNSQNRYTKDGLSSPSHTTTAAADFQSLVSPNFHEESLTTNDSNRNYDRASSSKREYSNGCSLRHETHKELYKYPADRQPPEANNHSHIAASSTSFYQDRNKEVSAQVVGGMQVGPRSYDLKSFFPPAAAARRATRPQSACFLCEPQPCCAQGLTGCRPVSQCFLPDCKLPGWGPGPGPDIERLTEPLLPRFPSTGPEAVSSGYESTSISTGPAAFNSRISSTPASPAAWSSKITSTPVNPDAFNRRTTTAGLDAFSSRTTTTSSAVPLTHDGRKTISSLSSDSGGPCHRRSVSTPYSGVHHSKDDHVYISSPAKFNQTPSTDCSATMSSSSFTLKRQECVEEYGDEKFCQSLIESENQLFECRKTFTPKHQAYRETEFTAWTHEKNNDKEATKVAKGESQTQTITTEGGSEEEKPNHNEKGHPLVLSLIQTQYDTECRNAASARSSPLDNKELCGTLYTITGCSATLNLTAHSPVPKPRSSSTIKTPVWEDRAAAVHPRTSSPVPRPAKQTTLSPVVASSFGSPGGFFSQETIPLLTHSAPVTTAPTRSLLKKFRSVDWLDRVEESDSSSDRSPPPPRTKSSFRSEEEERTELCPGSRPAQGSSSYFSRAFKLRRSSLRLYRSVEDLGSRSLAWSRPDCLVSDNQRPRTESSVYSYSDSTDTEQAGETEKRPQGERGLVHSSSQTIQGEEISCRRPNRKARPSSYCAAGSGHESGYFGGAGGGRVSSGGAGGSWLTRVSALSASAGDILDMLKRDEDEMHDVADDELSFERCGSLRKALSCGSLLRHSSVQDKAFAVMRRRRQKMKNRRLTQMSPNVRSSSTETDEGVDLRASLSTSSLNDQSDAGSRDRVAITSITLASKPHHEGVVKRLHSAHLKAWEVRLRRKQIQMKRRSYEMMTEEHPRRETLV